MATDMEHYIVHKFKHAVGINPNGVDWEKELHELLDAMLEDRGPMLLSYSFLIIQALNDKMENDDMGFRTGGVLKQGLAYEIYEAFVGFDTHYNLWQLASLVLDANILYFPLSPPHVSEERTPRLIVRNEGDLTRRGWVILKDSRTDYNNPETLKIFPPLSAREIKIQLEGVEVIFTDVLIPQYLTRIKDYLVGKYGRPSLDLLFQERKFTIEGITPLIETMLGRDNNLPILQDIINGEIKNQGFKSRGKEYKEALGNRLNGTVHRVIDFLQAELDKLVS